MVARPASIQKTQSLSISRKYLRADAMRVGGDTGFGIGELPRRSRGQDSVEGGDAEAGCLEVNPSRHREPERSEGVAIQGNVERPATLDRRVASLLAMTIPLERILL
jgi:hypothetical protein